MSFIMGATATVPFEGPPALRAPVLEALSQVIDPEVAMNVVDMGLVYGVALVGSEMSVQVTMTSAACPVADVILDDIEQELSRVLPANVAVSVELVWEPLWTPERMSDQARRLMGW